MNKYILNRILLLKKTVLFFLFFSLSIPAIPQTDSDYKTLYDNGEFEKSYIEITKKLNEIYSSRVEDKRIPSGYISMTNIGEDKDLIKLFRNRQEKGFFIEENMELSDLHYYAGLSSIKSGKQKDALNHLIQSLRYRKIQPDRDDIIYYEIATIFMSYKDPAFFKGYLDALEQAYTLNPKKISYSLELGNALYTTKEIKKAIFHMLRYIENTDQPIDPELYLKLGNLYESSGRYLETEKYYNEYLRHKPDNAEILFALGHICYTRTGNYILAESSLNRSIRILKDNDIYRRSKSFEYLGDMSYSNLKYAKAIEFFNQCISYQQQILDLIETKRKEIEVQNNEINDLKRSLIKDRQFEKYEDYEILIDEKNRSEKELETINLQFKKLNPGRVRWYLAESLNKTANYEDAIKYYRESIKYEYNTNNARDMIIKLKLKIKRGY